MDNHDQFAPKSRGASDETGSPQDGGEASNDARESLPQERLAYPSRDQFPYAPHPRRYQGPGPWRPVTPAEDEGNPRQSNTLDATHRTPMFSGSLSENGESGTARTPREPEGAPSRGGTFSTGRNPAGGGAPMMNVGQSPSGNTPQGQQSHGQTAGPQTSSPAGPAQPSGQPTARDLPWSNWEQTQQAKPAKKQRKGPGWVALVVVGLIASLLGGMLGVGVMNARWVNARPAEAPTNFTAGTTEIIETDGTGPDWATVAGAVENSVVAIDVSQEAGASAGSGFVIDEAGHIITNEHVVGGATAVYVTLHDGRVYEADIVGVDESTDLAVIKLQSPPSDLTVARFGDSSQVVVGDSVAAIGNPLGLSSTMTTGIVSALDRPVQTFRKSSSADSTRVITNAIQIDAAVNPGNSGGPVFDVSGQVIGVASSIASLGDNEGQAGSIGLGFAIPANLVQRVAGELITNGVAEHAFLGVSIVDGIGYADGTNWTGAEVRHVEPGTPADMSGMKAGDVVLKVNGRNVTSALALTGYVRQFASGDVISLILVRNGELLEVDVTLATRAD